jgi:signal transduction histidine kinase
VNRNDTFELHGGALKLRNREDGGFSAELRLPVKPGREEFPA